MNPKMVRFHLPTTDQFSPAVDTPRSIAADCGFGRLNGEDRNALTT
jgi:hypothetical protein